MTHVGIPPSFVKGSARLLLSHTQNMLEFEFAAIDIDAPRLVQYRYQLEGLEEGLVTPKGSSLRAIHWPPSGRVCVQGQGFIFLWRVARPGDRAGDWHRASVVADVVGICGIWAGPRRITLCWLPATTQPGAI